MRREPDRRNGDDGADGVERPAIGTEQEVFEFSVDDDSDTNPVVTGLKEAERNGTRITLDYRQDLHSLFRCTPSEYFITGLTK